jgi:hypothetical protein
MSNGPSDGDKTDLVLEIHLNYLVKSEHEHRKPTGGEVL